MIAILTTGMIGLPASAQWKTTLDADPITDDAIFLTTTVGDIPSKYGDAITLSLRCTPDDYDVFVSFNEYIGSQPMVTYRIDKEKPVDTRWDSATSKQGAFAPDNYIVDLIEGMVKGTKMVVRITPYNENPKTITFNMVGFTNSLKPYNKKCPVLEDFLNRLTAK